MGKHLEVSAICCSQSDVPRCFAADFTVVLPSLAPPAVSLLEIAAIPGCGHQVFGHGIIAAPRSSR
jgi:hypothetical protein